MKIVTLLFTNASQGALGYLLGANPFKLKNGWLIAFVDYSQRTILARVPFFFFISSTIEVQWFQNSRSLVPRIFQTHNYFQTHNIIDYILILQMTITCIELNEH
jgi:hypothetical protein